MRERGEAAAVVAVVVETGNVVGEVVVAEVFGQEEGSDSGLDPRGSGCLRRICVFRSQSS